MDSDRGSSCSHNNLHIKGHAALRRGRVSLPHYVYHVTTTTVSRQPVFLDFPSARIVAQCLNSPALLGDAHTLCWVLMPDHLHWLVELGASQELGALVRRVKGASAFQLNRRQRRMGASVWAPSFYDHAVRRDEDLRTMARYIIANPVRARLVESPRGYPHWDAVWDGAELL